jgi:hypothetical protein
MLALPFLLKRECNLVLSMYTSLICQGVITLFHILSHYFDGFIDTCTLMIQFMSCQLTTVYVF